MSIEQAQAFFEKVKNDEELQKRLSDAQDSESKLEIARQEGFVSSTWKMQRKPKMNSVMMSWMRWRVAKRVNAIPISTIFEYPVNIFNIFSIRTIQHEALKQLIYPQQCSEVQLRHLPVYCAAGVLI